MGLLDRLLGRTPADDTRTPAPPRAPQQAARHAGQPARTDDERALERYRYLLRTAPPETVEQAHEEAFAKLTPEQRRQVLTQLSAELPEAERARDDDPKSLARAATRAEVRQPGTLERAFGGRSGGMGVGGGVGLGGIVAGSLMGSIAGAFIGTAIADSLFDGDDGGGDDSADGGGDDGGGDDGSGADGGYQDDELSAAGDSGGDLGGGDYGGDFGGGDFGGGDFGGGDF